YARFRKEYFVSIAAGGDFFNFGLDILGFRRFNAPEVVGPGAGAGIVVPGSGARFSAGVNEFQAPTEGYLSNLLRAAFLDNERKNVKALEEALKLFNGFKEGGDISQLQVDQVETRLLQGRSTVLQREQDYHDSLDRF